MKMHYNNERNIQILIALLKKHKIKKVVISPRTTNVSLVGSLQSDPYFELYSSVDERSAAYIACGMAKESDEPIVLSCTGATAARNYFSGLTEAFYSKIPILAITSTPNIAKIGQNVPQITDRSQQPKDIVKLSLQLPVIYNDNDADLYAVKVNEALLELRRYGGSPVHINLHTTFDRDFSIESLPKVNLIDRINYDFAQVPVPPLPLEKLRTAIVIGAHQIFTEELIKAIEKFCEYYNGVVFCDSTSNYNGKYRVFFNLFGSQMKKFTAKRPDWLIYIGNISGAYFNLKATETWRVNPDGEIRSYFKTLRYVFEMQELTFFEKYVKMAQQSVPNTTFYEECRKNYDDVLNKISELPFSNTWIAKETCHRLPENSSLHLGILNSLRTWGFFELPHKVSGYSNTGGFGIDGCVSTLIGASLVSPNKLFFGVVGDLAFFYDMNSIGNRYIGNNIRLMVINNGIGTEFKLYDHYAHIFGEDANPYIAAAGHFGNKSSKLLKHYAEDLGFEYMTASNKDEYHNNVDRFLTNKQLPKPILFEIFTDSKNESDALYIIKNTEVDNDE